MVTFCFQARILNVDPRVVQHQDFIFSIGLVHKDCNHNELLDAIWDESLVGEEGVNLIHAGLPSLPARCLIGLVDLALDTPERSKVLGQRSTATTLGKSHCFHVTPEILMRKAMPNINELEKRTKEELGRLPTDGVKRARAI